MSAAPAPAPSGPDSDWLNFEPTTAQRKLLEEVAHKPSYRTIQKLCEDAGISPSTYYAWCKDLGFRAWFVRGWSSALLFEGWHLIHIARHRAALTPFYFKVVFDLVFDPKASCALSQWVVNSAVGRQPLPPEPPPYIAYRPRRDRPHNPQPDSPPYQPHNPENWSFHGPTTTTGPTDVTAPAPSSPLTPDPSLPRGGAAPRGSGPSVLIRRLNRNLNRAATPCPGVRIRRRPKPAPHCRLNSGKPFNEIIKLSQETGVSEHASARPARRSERRPAQAPIEEAGVGQKGSPRQRTPGAGGAGGRLRSGTPAGGGPGARAKSNDPAGAGHKGPRAGVLPEWEARAATPGARAREESHPPLPPPSSPPELKADSGKLTAPIIRPTSGKRRNGINNLSPKTGVSTHPAPPQRSRSSTVPLATSN